MKHLLSNLKVGSVIEVDCGYCGMIDMQPVTIISIGTSTDLWDNTKTLPDVVVRTSRGDTFAVAPDLFA